MSEYNEFGENLNTIRKQGVVIYCTGVLQLIANDYVLRIAALLDTTLPFIGLLVISFFVFIKGVINIYCGCLWAAAPHWKPELRHKLIRRKR